MGSGGMMGMGNGMIPMQVPGGQVPSMVPVGMPQASHHMQGARPRCLSYSSICYYIVFILLRWGSPHVG